MAKVIDCTKNANTLIHKKLKKVTVEEGLEIGLDLTKEERELYNSSRGLVIIFYS